MPAQILHVLGSAGLESASISQLVHALAIGLDGRRFGLHAWFLGSDGPWRGRLEAAGVRTRWIHWPGGWLDPAGARRFAAAFGHERFDLVHLHHGGRSVRKLARWCSGAPLLGHLHGDGSGARQRSVGIVPVDATVAVSHAAAQAVAPHAAVVHPGIHVAPRGVQLTANTVPGYVVFGTACRLVPDKGIGDLLQAFAQVCVAHPLARMEIAGEGKDRVRLESLAQRLGVGASVHFLGWQEPVRERMKHWDAFVLPSLREGFGLAALEAMAEGLPVVATRIGGLPELVVEGRTGFLVPPRSPGAIAARLALLAADHGLRLSMGAAARERAATHFSMGRMVEGFARVYGQLLTAAPRPH